MLGAGPLLLGAVFLLAGAAKLRDRAAFRRTLALLLPTEGRLATALGLAVPAAELALAALLLSGGAPRAAAALGLGALALFTVALVVLDRRAPRAPCGCFGGAPSRLAGGLARNAALGALAAALVVAPADPWSGAVVAHAALAAAALLVAAAAAAWRRRPQRGSAPRPGLLAGPQTRRGFLGRLAFAGAAASVAAVARDPERALAAGAPTGCNWGRARVNVCYTPYKVLRSEPADRLVPGHHGIAMRKGPSPDAPIVYKRGKPVIIPVGEFFGRQSSRDGGAARGCPPPPARPAVNGYVVGYPDLLGSAPDKTGWLPVGYGGETYSVADPTCPHVMCGPASLDFDCRGGTDDASPYRASCGHRLKGSKKRGGYACGGGPEDPGTCFPPRETFVKYWPQKKSFGKLDDLSREYYNLKYTEDGTTIYWLVPGDRVREYCIKCVRENPDPTCPPNEYDPHARGCCQSYSCVQVLEARWVPKGTRGWIGSEVLRDGGVPPNLRHSLDAAVRDVLFLGS